MDRILADFDRCGLVGEETNKLVCYLGCVSRLLDRPLAVMIQSSSAAGKTTLMDAALSFVPPGASDPLLGHDRPVALLHGPAQEPEAQDPGGLRRRRRGPSELRAETLAK